MSNTTRPIVLLAGPTQAHAAEIVRAALVRSFSADATRVRDFGATAEPEAAAVAIAPPESAADELARFCRQGRKLLLLGPLGPRVSALAGLAGTGLAQITEAEAFAPARLETPFDVSPARLLWNGADSALAERPFCRFDFEEEWNHQPHGRILPGETPWSLWVAPDAGDAHEVARAEVAGEPRGVAATRFDRPDATILWIGRPVGPVDGLDWTVVERFFSDHRAGELPCWPSWLDAPPGHDGSATFRLDCDEAVASSRPLFEHYRERGIPVSLAVLAGLDFDEEDRRLVADVLASGGTVLSHSLRHRPDWGADLDEARAEARGSRERLESLFSGAAPVRYAVSPFHRNPPHALRAVAENYEALVTGVVANDPECLIGRAGVLPFVEAPLVSHSQQNMLHGDCWARQKGSARAWIESFGSHRRAGALFGYLDHPFSQRYAYGWADESQRIAAHDELLDEILACENPWLPSQGEALGHLVHRSRARLQLDPRGRPRALASEGGPFTVRFAGVEAAV